MNFIKVKIPACLVSSDRVIKDIYLFTKYNKIFHNTSLKTKESVCLFIQKNIIKFLTIYC